MGSELSQRLFVYGTLKRGGSNQHWLEGAGWQGRARLAHHRLHDLGDYPMAVPGRGVVHGEVFDLDDAALARLDVLEDVPNEYQRRICRLEDGRQAWVYLGTPAQVRGLPRVPYDDWESIPVFCYGSDLDPGTLRRRYPAWDGTAWLARLPGWRWRAAGDDLCSHGVSALIQPDPHSACWGVVIHERRSSGRTGRHSDNRLAGQLEGDLDRHACAPGDGLPERGLPVWAGGQADGWRVLSLRLNPWHNGAHCPPLGAVARVWWPEAGRLPSVLGPFAKEFDPHQCRERLLAGAFLHGLPEQWCQFLREAMAASP